jgi:choline dehydrogenase-like flavoprotein
MLGGSTGLNFMAWDHASSAEYDAWATFSSSSAPVTWDYDGLLPYFKKSESLDPRNFNVLPGVSNYEYWIAAAEFLVDDGFIGPVSVSSRDIARVGFLRYLL